MHDTQIVAIRLSQGTGIRKEKLFHIDSIIQEKESQELRYQKNKNWDSLFSFLETL
jgi:hypothetical protein